MRNKFLSPSLANTGKAEIAKMVGASCSDWTTIRPRVGPVKMIDDVELKFADASLAGFGAGVPNQTAKPPKIIRTARDASRRAFDVACAVTGLAVLAPLLAIVAAAVKLEDGGPVFFTQLRVGKGLGRFRILKFRTMFTNSSGTSLLTAPEDPRVTRVGRFLRKYKVDELPQLVNVVRGEMQLVGVRPQVECFVKPFLREYEVLLQDRPGITDPATIAYRHEEQMFHAGPLENQYLSQILPKKLGISLKYYQARSFFSDLGILFRTVLGSKSNTIN
jgi:lipopolysaccharide/colanic/teichoic acid biosynthesis glycosyltransferase